MKNHNNNNNNYYNYLSFYVHFFTLHFGQNHSKSPQFGWPSIYNITTNTTTNITINVTTTNTTGIMAKDLLFLYINFYCFIRSLPYFICSSSPSFCYQFFSSSSCFLTSRIYFFKLELRKITTRKKNTETEEFCGKTHDCVKKIEENSLHWTWKILIFLTQF